MEINELSKEIIGILIQVHSKLGPGLLEKIYEEAVCRELIKTGLAFERQVRYEAMYDGKLLGLAFKADIVIANRVIIELKSVECLTKRDYKQLLTYLKLSGISLGLLVNFNVDLLKDGLSRVVNNLEENQH